MSNIEKYRKYFTKEYLMGPNSFRLLGQRLMAEATSLQLSGSADEGRAFSYLCYKQAC